MHHRTGPDRARNRYRHLPQESSLRRYNKDGRGDVDPRQQQAHQSVPSAALRGGNGRDGYGLQKYDSQGGWRLQREEPENALRPLDLDR